MTESKESEPEPILLKLIEKMNIKIDSIKSAIGKNGARIKALKFKYSYEDLENFYSETSNRRCSVEMPQKLVVKHEENFDEGQKVEASQETSTSNVDLDEISRNRKLRSRYKPATSRLGDFKTEEWVHNWYHTRPAEFRRRHAQSTVSIPPRNDFERRTGLRVGYKYSFPRELPSDVGESEGDEVP